MKHYTMQSQYQLIFQKVNIVITKKKIKIKVFLKSIQNIIKIKNYTRQLYKYKSC